MTALDEVGGHRFAHVADTDKDNLHGGDPCVWKTLPGFSAI
jgi:hypothetical protein